MPKLPSDFVKPPSFDNPLRSTAGTVALAERKLVLRLAEATWDAVWAASEREGSTPEAVIKRALERWLSEPEAVAMAPHASVDPTQRPSLRAQVIERLQEELERIGWVQRLLALRAFLRTDRV